MSSTAQSEPEFDGLAKARELLRTVRAGALATLDPASGGPFASLVNVATDTDGSPLLLLSRLAAHTRHLEAEPRASLLLAETGKGDPLTHPRLTLSGRAARSPEPRVRRRFLSRHPKAKLYADFGDFSFWRLEMEAAHLNGGFARAMSLNAADLRTDLAGAEEIVEIEESALDHLNAEHREALELYARLVGADGHDWRASGLDPEGLDLMAGSHTARLPFPERVATGKSLRSMLKSLADQARTLLN